MSFDIVLRHIGGEKKTVTVEYVAPTLTYISIRWGQSGVYDLNLGANKLTARSQKAQRKGKPHWSADDIDAVRKAARAHLDEKRGNPHSKNKEAFRRHVESMPGNNPRIVERNAFFDEYTAPLDREVDKILQEGFTPFPSYMGDPDIE